MKLTTIFSAAMVTVAALSGNANAVPVSITTGTFFLDNVGGDPGIVFDILQLNSNVTNFSLNYGQSTTVTLQTLTFTVGDTGSGSGGRVEPFSLARSVSINGAAGTLLQSGQVSISSSDTLALQESATFARNLVSGMDRYNVALVASGLTTTRGVGTHNIPILGQVSLTNIEDAPIAALTGTSLLSFGSNLMLDASLSFDPDQNGNITSYRWDINNDGIYDLTAGAQLNLNSAAYGFYLANVDGFHTIKVEATDNTGRSSTAAFITQLLGTDVAEVPEPNSGLLLLIGVAGLAAAQRRRTRPAVR